MQEYYPKDNFSLNQLGYFQTDYYLCSTYNFET